MIPDLIRSSLSTEPLANSKLFYPPEKVLRDLAIVSPQEEITQTTTIFDSGMRSESWIYGIRIGVQNLNGEIYDRYLREKNIISFGMDLIAKAASHYEKSQDLERLGIPQPRMYGLRGATVYQEFIVADYTQQALSTLRAGRVLDENTKYLLDQLIDIGLRLDSGRYSHPGFVSDVHYDGRNFLVIDTGEDLGYPQHTSSRNSINGLKRRFLQFSSYIDDQCDKIHTPQKLTA